MNIVVITDEKRRAEWGAQAGIQFIEEINCIDGTGAYIDLLFQPVKERIEALQKIQPALIFVNAVTACADDFPGDFIRFNGWPTFFTRSILEASCENEGIKKRGEQLMGSLGKKTEWVPSTMGFVTPRVVSMIVNEAYFALDEKVSSKEEIDIAMKLGTNYPYGPFEWSEKIGLRNIYELLELLSQNNPRYKPSDLLTKEALGL